MEDKRLIELMLSQLRENLRQEKEDLVTVIELHAHYADISQKAEELKVLLQNLEDLLSTKSDKWNAVRAVLSMLTVNVNHSINFIETMIAVDETEK